jgi:glycosyltransferase involved in cell wall biosynthesis
MDGYRSDRCYLISDRSRSVRQLAGGIRTAVRRARTVDLVHLHGEMASGLCLPSIATRPSVVTLHGLHLARRSRGLRHATAALNLRAVVRAADRTICVSEAERDHLRALAGPAALARARVVRNGVRLPPPPLAGERDRVREELGLAPAEAVGIWVGGLDEHKDPLTAVRAAVRAPLPLLVVGDGPLRRQVERAAHGPVRVLGLRSDVPRLLAAADVFLLTSRREGLAYALLEAMAAGLPSVVTALPENLEAVDDAGLSFPLGDEESLLAAVRRLAADEHGRALLGERARRRVVEHFGAEQMVAATRAVYDEVLDGRAGRD